MMKYYKGLTQTNTLSKQSMAALREENVGCRIFLTQDEYDSAGELLYEKGWYEIAERIDSSPDPEGYVSGKYKVTKENGEWIYNTFYNPQELDVNFTSNGMTFNKLVIYNGMYPDWTYISGDDGISCSDSNGNYAFPDEAYKTIDFGSELQAVPTQLNELLTNDAEKLADTEIYWHKIDEASLRDVVDVYDNAPAPADDQPGELSGVYVWKEEPFVTQGFNIAVNFTSKNISYATLMPETMENSIIYKDSSGNIIIAYYPYGSPKWNDEAYRTVDFGEKQTGIDLDFWNWFRANADKQMPNQVLKASNSVTPDPEGTVSGVYKVNDDASYADLSSVMERDLYGRGEVNFTCDGVEYIGLYEYTYWCLILKDGTYDCVDISGKELDFGAPQSVWVKPPTDWGNSINYFLERNAVKIRDYEPPITQTDIVHHSTDSMIVGDLIKVLKDETHEDKMTYYRWDGTEFIFDREEDIVSVWEKGTGENSVQTVGTDCQAQGDSSVAEGFLSMTLNDPSGAIEDWNEGKSAHAEGGGTTAAGNFSHTEGNGTVANNPYEHAEGHFNISNFDTAVYPNKKNTIHSVGIGSNLSNRKNAEEIMQNGDKFLIGVGGYDGTNPYTSHTAQDAINLQHGTEFPTENLYDGMKFVLDENYNKLDPVGKVSGKYYFNEHPEMPWLSEIPVEFVSNETQYHYLHCDGDYLYIHYNVTFGERHMVYNGGWHPEAYRTVDFGSEQTISTDYWNWLQNNATKLDAKSYKKGIYHYSSTLADWVLDADVSEPMLHGTEFPTEPKKDQYFVLDEDFEGGGTPDPEGYVSGEYQFKEVIELMFPSTIVNFTSNNISFTSMFDDAGELTYSGEEIYNVYTGLTVNMWQDEAFRLIDFGTTRQPISIDFDTWLKANATKQAGKSYQKGLYRYDSTLEDWVKVANWVDVDDVTLGNITFSGSIKFKGQTNEQIAALHNGIYRGYNLVSRFGSIENIHAAVANWDFADIYVGDYIDVTITTSYKSNESVRLLVAGINVRLHKGDTELTAPHLALVPEDCFATTAQMNSSNTTAGGYSGCAMKTDVLPKYATALNSALGNHLLDFKCLWSKTVNTSAASGAYSAWQGASSDWGWESTKITLLSEVEVYGTRVLSSSFYDVGEANNQLPLFALRQDKMVAYLGKGSTSRSGWWLRAVVDSTYFASVSTYGNAGSSITYNAFGVRPLVLFG